MSDLPKDNRCSKCGEWFHNAHACAGAIYVAATQAQASGEGFSATELEMLAGYLDAKTPVQPAEAAPDHVADTDKMVACEWSYESDTDAWNTGCGALFQFSAGGPEENAFWFCCYCGGKLAVKENS